MIRITHRSGHGQTLQRIRRRMGATRQQVAEILGVSVSAVRLWEIGHHPLSRQALLMYASLARREHLPWLAAVLDAA